MASSSLEGDSLRIRSGVGHFERGDAFVPQAVGGQDRADAASVDAARLVALPPTGCGSCPCRLSALHLTNWCATLATMSGPSKMLIDAVPALAELSSQTAALAGRSRSSSDHTGDRGVANRLPVNRPAVARPAGQGISQRKTASAMSINRSPQPP